MLTRKQLKELRGEVVAGSVFLYDYNNSLYIKPDAVSAFLDGFYEFIDGDERRDNINELYNYYLMFECDPLPQDDYIAVKPECNYGGLGILSFVYGLRYGDRRVRYRRDWSTSFDPCRSKIKTHKLYYNAAMEEFFIDNGRRIYLKEFARCN